MIDHAGWLLLWGMVVGLDLISVGQVMISRPLVAGTVAGLIAGDPAAGATAGIILELFALDVLPVGAARYPDYGLGAVAATAAAAGAPSILGTGLGVAAGLLVAYVGDVSIHVVRLRNARDVALHRAVVDAGDPHALSRLHMRGLARDALRALAVTAFGLLVAVAAPRWLPLTVQGAVFLDVVAVGAALAAAVAGAIRLTGRGSAVRWLVIGVAVGIAGVVLG